MRRVNHRAPAARGAFFRRAVRAVEFSPRTGHAPAVYSLRVQQALTYAALRHAGQVRKLTGAPYFIHPVYVARLVAAHGYDEDHEIVALLHDVLEDTCKDREEREAVRDEIAARFGAPVAEAVDALSEPKRDAQGARLRWPDRKRAYLAQLEAAESLAVVVSAADKIHNLATLCRSLDEAGPQLWSKFRGGPEESLWFYREVLAVVGPRLGGAPITAELAEHVAALAERVESA